MVDHSDVQRFESLFRPHMTAAYNLARYLTGQDNLAQDAVQESYLRAFKYLDRFAGGNARAWLLAIVRNQSYRTLGTERRGGDRMTIGQDMMEDDAALSHGDTPELALLQSQDAALVRQAIAALPAAAREMIVLRDLEDMSYKDIAEITGNAMGTVMSRLSRARAQLKAEILRRRGDG